MTSPDERPGEPRQRDQGDPSRILVNAANLLVGGGLQGARSVVLEALRDRDCSQWSFALSPPLRAALGESLDCDPARLFVFDRSPARSRMSRRRLPELAASIEADAVFTVFGPTFTEFGCPHLMGLANSWLSNATWLAYRSLRSPFRMAASFAWAAYVGRWARYADAWVTETEAVRHGMVERLGLPGERIAVVPNTCSDLYRHEPSAPGKEPPLTPHRFLCFAAGHAHKRIEFCPSVAAELRRRRPSLEFEFLVTLPEDGATWRRVHRLAQRLGVEGQVRNLGVVSPSGGPALYQSSTLLFLPTVLECFSASYPEAMAMNRPIVTTDLDFARTVCGSAAAYFRPEDPGSAADSLLHVLDEADRRESLIAQGRAVLSNLPTPRQRFQRYRQLLAALVQGQPSA